MATRREKQIDKFQQQMDELQDEMLELIDDAGYTEAAKQTKPFLELSDRWQSLYDKVERLKRQTDD